LTIIKQTLRRLKPEAFLQCSTTRHAVFPASARTNWRRPLLGAQPRRGDCARR